MAERRTYLRAGGGGGGGSARCGEAAERRRCCSMATLMVSSTRSRSRSVSPFLSSGGSVGVVGDSGMV